MTKENVIHDDLMVKIPFWKKIGYCFGGMTDTIAYDFVAMFMLFFMTDLAGISPALAGVIVSLGVIWDMITDPIVGGLADRTRTRFGKKRTWLLIALPTLLGSYLLLFTCFDSLTGGAKNAYFIIMALMFWLSYTFFSIPYYSMGASMTMDNDERSKIRMLGQIIQYVGVFFSTVAPTLMVTFFLNKGFTDYEAWHYTAWLEAALCTLTLLIVFISTKGIELDIKTENKEEVEKTNFFKDAIDVLKIKPYLLVTLSSLAFRVGYCFVATTMTYFYLYTCGISPAQMSIVTAIISFGGIAVIAVLMKVVFKVDKVKLYAILIMFTAVCLIVFNFININGVGLLCLFAVLYLVGTAAYWSMNMPMMYDTIEVDEFQSGKRREGTMFSLYLCCQKAGYAIAALAVGAILTAVGYDDTLGAANPQHVLDAIQAMYCIGGGVFFLLSGAIMLIYPLKKDVYQKLYAQLEKKRAGEDFNTEGFAHVLNKKYR